MFPKNITPFIFQQPNLMPSAEKVQEKLQTLPAAPVLGLDWFTEGFTPPMPFSNDLAFVTDETISGCLKRSERVLPSSVIKAEVDERVAAIQENENRSVGKKERAEIKEQVTDDLLPKAFIRESRSFFLSNQSFFFVYESSPKKAENIVSKVREALGGLAVQYIKTQQSAQSAMTSWLLNGSMNDNFEFGDYALLQGADKHEKIKIMGKNVTNDDVLAHIKSGFQVRELGLIWREQIAFTLSENFVLKGIHFLDVLQEKASNQGDDAASLMTAQQLIASANLSELMNELIDLCGGLELPQN